MRTRFCLVLLLRAAHSLRVAVVQWTHTMAMKNALLYARLQLSERRSGPAVFSHHIVLQSCGVNASGGLVSCPQLRSQLLPLEENVTCFDPKAMMSAVPSQLSLGPLLSSRHGMAGLHASPIEMQIGHWRWCWHSCDVAYIAWYAVERSRVLENDFFLVP